MKSPAPLRRFLSLQFGMMAVLPVVLIAILVWQFLVPQMRNNIGIQHKALARAIAGQISAHLMGGERQLVALAHYIETLKSTPKAQLLSLLDAQCGNGELFETIYISNDDDDAISSIGLARVRRSRRQDLMGMDLSGRDFIQRAHSMGNTFWSETFLSTASSRLAVALTVPMPDRIIIGEITLGQLSVFISHLPVEAGLFTMVLDGQGRIVADSQLVRTGQHLNMQTLPAGDIDSQSHFVSSAFNLDGKQLLGTVVGIKQLGWKVLVAQPIKIAYKPMQAAFIMIALSLAAALVAALVIGWLRADKLSQIFQLYARHAQSIAQGQYDLHWPQSKTAEFDHLAQSLQHMAQMICKREKQLVASETNIRITLQSIGDAVIATDDRGAITRMNPMAEKLTGWSTEDAVGRQLSEVFQIVNAHTRQGVANPVEKVLSKGEIVGLANHTVLIARDGQEYQIADSGAPIRHTDGQIVGVVLVFRDITEIYAQERRIRDNQELLQNITANVPGVVYQLNVKHDYECSCRYISPKAAEIFGIDRPVEPFFEAFTQCMPGNEKNRFMQSIREAADNFQPWHYEGRFTKPSGEHMWFSGSASPQRVGTDIVFYGVWMDISARRKLEDTLRMTQFCFDKASFGIFLIGPLGQILNANEQAIQNVGYTREELSAMSINDIDRLVNSDHWNPIWQQATYVFESIHRRKDGSEMPVYITSNLLEYGGQQFSIFFVQDISDRKKAEQEAKRLQQALLQAQKMEAIGTLAGGIAHDFNNILSAVIGFSELSLPLVASDSPLHSNIQKILTAGLRARDLVRQILTFSRKDERELRPLQIAPLVREVLKLLRSSLPATIEISQHIALDVDHVMADPTQIHQIVMNLCTNAAHAMEADGGTLSVVLSQVQLSEKDIRLHPGLLPGGYAKLSVQDTGVGIHPEIMEKIFDPYFTTKESEKGTGLGLSVVHGIVQSYGGAVYAYSEAQAGTTFNVYIPIVKTMRKDIQKEKPALPRGREHILFVDDEPFLIEIGRQLLENLGYRVSSADSSQAALDAFRKVPHDFDLVLTDMTMPKITGDRLAAELLKIRPDIPIILSTGYSARITTEKALEKGIRALIFKPIVEAELAEIVRTVLDKNKNNSPNG